jgi:N utilization substance protein A
MKGMRVQSIIRELRGEKIDIIEYSDDPVVFATHALSPAKVSRITILDPVEKHMEVIVDDSQLSLAIGKKGQNVRLAAKLLTWRIDIKSEEEKRQEVESQMAALVAPGAPVSVLIDYGLPDKLLETLLETGVGTIEKLGGMTPEQLEEIPGIGPELVEKIQEAVNAYYSQFEEQGQGEAAPAAAEEAVEAGPAAAEEAVETQAVAAGDLPSAVEVEPISAPAPEETPSEPVETEEIAEQSATIVDAGSPTHNSSEGTGPEDAAPGEHAGPDGGDLGRDK